MSEPSQNFNLDFANTEIAFSNKSDKELKKADWLFRMMNNRKLVNIGSQLGLWAIRWRIPFTETVVRNTIFPQFCGGENLLDCQKSIDKLYDFDTMTILDFGAEGKTEDNDLNATLQETLRAIEMAASNNSVPVVVTKFTGLIDTEILEKLHKKVSLNDTEKGKYQKFVQRVEEICEKAAELEVGLYIDAEESWIQDPIDEMALAMMEKYNKESATIFNTYQFYNHTKLATFKDHHQKMSVKNVILGAKLVRGAYMDKERARAAELGYESPIQPDKVATDRDYNLAIRHCIDNIQSIASCCASHNAESNILQAQLIHERGIDRKNPNVNFCQLYGMSDNITFNLADAGYNAAKYVVYGPIKDVIPYLIRRTQENASVSGEMGREAKLINTEMIRRGIKK
jgi:proline dehydrogenase